jgi:hypothetical protein
MYSEGWEAIQWESYLCILEDVLCLSYYSILNYIELYHACIYNNNIIIEEAIIYNILKKLLPLSLSLFIVACMSA